MADIEYTVGETAITVSFLGAAGPGVAAGGTTGQALVKASDDDYDTEWAASAAPVDSVNGKIGDVVLDPDDLDDTATTHKFASAADLAAIGTAVQPGDLSTVATTGAYSDLSGTPTLGTAAATDATAYATAAQGSTADSATQPGDDAATLGSGASADGQVLTSDGLGNSAWETPASGVTDHGLLDGLADDDHSQYALADGSRGSFATTAQGSLADSAVQPGDLATVATTGAYSDVTGTPTLATVATSGDYDDLTNKPTLGTAASSDSDDFAAAGLLTTATTNAQTGTTYTLVLADAGKLVTLSNAAAITLTVPPNSSVAFPVGTRIALLQIGAGQVTVAQGSGVTVNTAETLKLADQYSAAELLKTATDTWVLFGRLEAAA